MFKKRTRQTGKRRHVWKWRHASGEVIYLHACLARTFFESPCTVLTDNDVHTGLLKKSFHQTTTTARHARRINCLKSDILPESVFESGPRRHRPGRAFNRV
ncbi:hypothetical protein L596_029802 [Steinernema carpocapsae]|uniref:Uncharacterized protein n=1 Tax=Steinernema carpocapsae TaxID=34508 RepID=A0A4U5LQU4_STECR|nr:hypothetical protein L596_029802 [Steinernema carpocapsae]